MKALMVLRRRLRAYTETVEDAIRACTGGHETNWPAPAFQSLPECKSAQAPQVHWQLRHAPRSLLHEQLG